jgi:hypothetical protein
VSAAACGTKHDNAPAPIRAKPVSSPAPIDPSSSREALANATLAALSAGDVDALAKLEDLFHAPVVSCSDHHDNDANRYLDGRLAEQAQHAQLTLVRIPSDRPQRLVAAFGCISKGRAEITSHEMTVVLRIAKAGHPAREISTELDAFDVGGVWFLHHAPDVGPNGELHEFERRTCACTDATCAASVVTEVTEWKRAHADELALVRPAEVASADEQITYCKDHPRADR